MARPTIALTHELTERICQAIRTGASFEVAADYAGISYRTLLRWRKLGEEEDTKENGSVEFWQFCQAIKSAQTECVMTNLTIIANAAHGGKWQAAAWKLERLYPHIYGRTSRDKKEVEEESITAVEGRNETD